MAAVEEQYEDYDELTAGQDAAESNNLGIAAFEKKHLGGGQPGQNSANFDDDSDDEAVDAKVKTTKRTTSSASTCGPVKPKSIVTTTASKPKPKPKPAAVQGGPPVPAATGGGIPIVTNAGPVHAVQSHNKPPSKTVQIIASNSTNQSDSGDEDTNSEDNEEDGELSPNGTTFIPKRNSNKPSSKSALKKQNLQLQRQLGIKSRECEMLKEDTKLILGQDAGGKMDENDLNAPLEEILKKKLYQMAQKSRRQQVTIESQKTKIEALEKLRHKDHQQVMKQQPPGGANSNPSSSCNLYNATQQNQQLTIEQQLANQDFRPKFLQASNQLQETRRELSDLKQLAATLKKVLLWEFGNDKERVDELVRGCTTAATGILVQQTSAGVNKTLPRPELERKISDLRQEVKQLQSENRSLQLQNSSSSFVDPPPAQIVPEEARLSGDHGAAQQLLHLGNSHLVEGREHSVGPGPAAQPPSSKTKVTNKIEKLADEKRQRLRQFEKDNSELLLQNKQLKQQKQAGQSRVSTLEKQVSTLKQHLEKLMEKSERDDVLIDELKQKTDGAKASRTSKAADKEKDKDGLLSCSFDPEKAKLLEQVERQAALIRQLRGS
ncbi:unnamed protein product [Amoebophrya sp. A120]|nr:unnamed protein product [Amoebophrya sp. A120]|eukprot:GSA120T00023925001.1